MKTPLPLYIIIRGKSSTDETDST